MSKTFGLIIGLGNPGDEYANTRHNAGAWWLEQFCQKQHIKLKADPKLQAMIADWSCHGMYYKLAIPTSFMNHSGRVVSGIADYFNIQPQQILVVHDELDLKPGVIQFKTDGGHAGHNGLRDIIHHLKTKAFHRLRLGIGHPGDKNLVSDYVLSRPSTNDKNQIDCAILDSMDNAMTTIEALFNFTTKKQAN